jgi:hypothetical protein
MGGQVVVDQRRDAAGSVDDASARPRSRPRGRGKRPVLMWIAGFLLVVLGTELVVRATSDRLDDPLRYMSSDVERVVADLDVLQQAHVRSDLTFVGTSMVRRDVAANDFEKLLDDVKWAHNVALPGAQADVVERWMLEEVMPRVHARRVVWGISSMDFNDRRPSPTIEKYDVARATQKGFYGDADRDIEALSMSRYREQLRDPLKAMRALDGKGRDFEQKRKLGDRAVWPVGFPDASPAQIAKGRAAHMRSVRDKQLKNYRVGPRMLEAYTHTIAELRKQGVDVAIVLMPAPTFFVPLHPRGEADFADWKTKVTAAAKAQDVPVLDLTRSMPDRAFRDMEHLDREPAHEFSAKLADQLKALGW